MRISELVLFTVFLGHVSITLAVSLANDTITTDPTMSSSLLHTPSTETQVTPPIRSTSSSSRDNNTDKRCCQLGQRMARKGIANCNLKLELAARVFALKARDIDVRGVFNGGRGQRRDSSKNVRQIRALRRCQWKEKPYTRCCMIKLRTFR